MKLRLTSAFFLTVFLFYWLLFTGEVQFCLISTVVIAWTMYEFFSAVKKHKPYRPFTTMGVTGGVVILLYQLCVHLIEGLENQVELVFLLVMLMIFAGEVFRKEKQSSIANVAITIFGIFFLGYLGSYIIHIRFFENAQSLILFLFIVTKMNDVGAYFIGSRWGHIKLAKFISPKKTVEGALGGIFTGVITAAGLWVFMKHQLPAFTLADIISLSLLLGVMGQLGDLFESMLKRDLGIKDFRQMIPGFGGALDILDSMFFAIPALYFYMSKLMMARMG